MRIAIITLHSVINFGSALQAFALNHFLTANGYNVVTIDYRPTVNLKIFGLVDKKIARNILRHQVAKILFFMQLKKVKRKFELFIDQNITLSEKRYTEYKTLQNTPPAADLYITGSDQLWNGMFPCGNDPAYYLQFVKEGKKMSYAVSLGRDEITNGELLEVKQRILDFDTVSVREISGKEQLESVGLKNVCHVLDPVFLLDKQEYLHLAKNTAYSNYLLVYAEKDERVNNLAIFIADKLKLKIISIGGMQKKCNSDIHDRTADPVDFLSYIANATFILTGSFHCVAFSLIMNKNFAVVLPSVASARLKDILGIVGLTERIVNDLSEADMILNPIDYSKVTPLMNKHINRSRMYLLDTVSNFKST